MKRRAGLALLAATLAVAAATDQGSDTSAASVRAEAVPLDPRDARVVRVGGLEFRGGLALASTHPRFGGFSGIAVSEDGRELTAVTDEGSWLAAELLYDGAGRLAGLEGARLGPLRDLEGRALHGKAWQDAESLARLPGGALLVGFEHQHRLWSYAEGLAGPARALPPPPGLERCPANGGLEALVELGADGLLALTEDLVEGNAVIGFLLTGSVWSRLSYRVEGALRPVGAAALPDGDVVVLERSHSALSGVEVRLMRLAAESFAPSARLQGTPLATLAPPLSVDNFEAVACRPGRVGEALVYLMSDDNFSERQRTLLLLFALPSRAAAGP